MKNVVKILFSLAFVMSFFLLLMACGSEEAPVVSQEQPQDEQVAEGSDVAEKSSIVIESAWSRSTPEMMEGSGIVYLTLKNTGNQSDKLLTGQTPVAEAVELHKHTMDENGVLRMRMVDGGYIEIPAGESVDLEPGGLHIMLINLTQALEAETTFPLTLKFEQMGEVTIDVPVVEEEAPEAGVAMEMATEAPEEAATATPIPTATTSAEEPETEDAPAEMAAGPAPTPRSPEDLAGGFFINLTTDNIDSAAMAIGFATKVRQNTGKPVTIFMNTQGVRLVDTNIPQNVHKSGKTIHEMLQMFMDEGGVALVCPVCMKNVGGMEEMDILPGVIIGSPEYTWSAMFAEGVTVISY